MDNKFVHIDHLFKDGLHGGEEQERDGAWMRMKELLDKEMPVGIAAPVTRPFRRYWMPALLLLLVTSAGGSYYFINRHPAVEEKLPAEATVAVRHSGNTLSVPDATGRESGTGNRRNITGLSSAAGVESTGGVLSAKRAEHVRMNIDNSGVHHAAAHSGENKASGKMELGDITATSKANGKDHNTGLVSHKTAKNKHKTDGTPRGNKDNPIVASSLAATNSHVKKGETFSKEEINAAQKELKVMADNGNLVALGDGPIVKKSEQEITRLAVKERAVYENTSRRNRKFIGLVMDTTSVSKKKEVLYEELTPLEVAALNRMKVSIDMNNVVPMASSVRFANGERGVKLVALSEFKVKSKKTAPEKINEMIGNTRSGISALFDGTRKYYAALMLGGNASIGNPSAFGLQLGIAGFYALSERWTLGAELKYFNRSFSNYKLADEFVTYRYGTPTMSGAEFLYSYEEKNEGKYYKVQNFATLELPVTLTYNLGRVSLFGGPNLAYGFAMNPLVATEVNAVNKTVSTSTAKFPYASETAKVVATDFKSRLGLGYVFGMTYDLSRNFSLDARMAQTVWDNATGEMSKQLSNAVFRKPSFQFGLNIYFGRREKVTYILER